MLVCILYSGEDILRLLFEIEVYVQSGMDVVSSCCKACVSDKTYYAWRKKFGGMGRSQFSEMKSLQKDNKWLNKNVAELELDKLILKESINFSSQRFDEGLKTSGRYFYMTKTKHIQATYLQSVGRCQFKRWITNLFNMMKKLYVWPWLDWLRRMVAWLQEDNLFTVKQCWKVNH